MFLKAKPKWQFLLKRVSYPDKEWTYLPAGDFRETVCSHGFRVNTLSFVEQSKKHNWRRDPTMLVVLKELKFKTPKGRVFCVLLGECKKCFRIYWSIKKC